MNILLIIKVSHAEVMRPSLRCNDACKLKDGKQTFSHAER